MNQGIDLTELLAHIDPAALDYSEWTAVGMALKEEGYSVGVWEDWSARDSGRFHSGECEKKWKTFNGAGTPVTGGTIYQMALDHGYMPEYGHELDWGDTIKRDDLVVVDSHYIENREIREPEKWDPAGQLIKYLETLFEAGENVGYVMRSWKNEKGKYIPQDRGNWDRTAGQLIEELAKCKGDIGKVLGDYDKEGGAWIRFNPLDGKGVRNDNVSDFRYALVESDDMELDRQNAIIRELELPIAVLMYSGGKSLHAIVKVDAPDYTEYRKRVDYLYEVCGKNGLKIDTQNRNPSRLSRMPGVIRGDKKQYIIDTGIGKESWAEWKDWIESVNDDLPDIEEMDDVWNDMPDLADCLIDGILRKGHKMLIAGPSKAGKSFLQIELAIAIAEGQKWLGWQCSQGRVMYVNLELDRASCLHRFRDVYTALKLKPENLKNIDIWNLRGKAVPMDKLAPKLIRKAQKKQYQAIIIDPIYKVITGDENSANQMAEFCNQFDLVCTALGCAVIYCHHHSKGGQGQKRAIDRASGSGVFARDPDAHLDMIELETTDALLKQEINKAICKAVMDELPHCLTGWNWRDEISQDDALNAVTLLNICENKLNKMDYGKLNEIAIQTEQEVRSRSTWRIEGTLREFKAFEPVNMWFAYPIHVIDESGSLKDVQPEEEKPAWQKMKERVKEESKERRAQVNEEFMIAFEGLVDEDGKALLADIAEQIGVSQNTVGLWLGKGKKGRKELREKFTTCKSDDDYRQYVTRRENEKT